MDPVYASLNEGDVFVLDSGKQIFVWVGKEAGLVKQSKGMEIANMINSENKVMSQSPDFHTVFLTPVLDWFIGQRQRGSLARSRKGQQ